MADGVANGGFDVDEHSKKSYIKNRAYLTSSFVLDAITLLFYRQTLWNV